MTRPETATPRVSILIACHNAEAYVGATLASVIGQTWENTEIVVVDDGSTDGSRQVVETFAGHDLRLISQARAGAAAARNRAFAVSTGDLIHFIDADDLIGTDKISRQVARLTGRPGCVATAPWGRFRIDPQEAVFVPETNWEDLGPMEWLARSRQDGLGMFGTGVWLIPRGLVEAAGPWNEALSLGDDGEFFTRVALAAERMLFCPGAHFYYRSGVRGSLSGSRNWSSAFRSIALCEAHVLAREDSDRARRGFALSWQHLAHACYPYDSQIAEHALACAQALHRTTVRPAGGPAFKLMSRVIGWRAARRLQVASGRP